MYDEFSKRYVLKQYKGRLNREWVDEFFFPGALRNKYKFDVSPELEETILGIYESQDEAVDALIKWGNTTFEDCGNGEYLVTEAEVRMYTLDENGKLDLEWYNIAWSADH